MVSRTRRGLLAAVAAGVSGLAGCGGRSGPAREPFGVPSPTEARTTDDTSTPDPTRTHTPVAIPESGRAGPAPSCPEGVTPFDPAWVTAGGGPMAGFILLVSKPRIAVGETLAFELRNVARGARSTGVKREFDLQYRAADGWHTVFGATEEVALREDPVVDHPPGEGFTWRFPFSREGLGRLDAADGYGVCGPIGPGTYRFVYYGVTGERERATDGEVSFALAREIRVTE